MHDEMVYFDGRYLTHYITAERIDVGNVYTVNLFKKYGILGYFRPHKTVDNVSEYTIEATKQIRKADLPNVHKIMDWIQDTAESMLDFNEHKAWSKA